MNETVRELDLIRTQLRTAIERDLQDRSPRSRVLRRRSVRIAIPTLAVGAAATAIVLGLIVSAASPSAASAAARRALAATAAATSGTLRTTVLHAGTTQTVEGARWSGNDIAFSPEDGPIPQLLLIGSGMYVQTSDGAWWHYANASDVGPKPLGGMAQLAQETIAGTTPQQILALATGVQKTEQPDGSTLYTGTIPSSSLNPATVTGNDAITSMILGAQKRTDMMSGAEPNQGGTPGTGPSDLQLQMSVGADGLVKQVSVTFQQQGSSPSAADGTYTWSVAYSQLGSTPPITPPASSTDLPPGTLPPGTLPPGTLPPGSPSLNTRTQGTQNPTITAADRPAYLKAAACIRSHGFPNFPNPTFGKNTVTFNLPPNINTNSSQAKRAEAICVKLIPPGLPYSNNR
jgi:hypothetical protein